MAVLLFLFSAQLFAQEIIIKGKITDAETGEGMPLVNVVNKKTGMGVNTDFDGFYSIKLINRTDSLTAFYFGYKEKTKAIKEWISQTMNFQLESDASSLEEVTIHPGENPAFRILRGVVANKDKNDKRSLTAYEYESYNRIEISVDNLSEKFRKKKVFSQITRIFDSLSVISGEDGKPILPMFISEAISNYYYRRDPQKTKEEIKGTKIIGVGMDDGSMISQLIGSSFQEYNFYKNYLTILEKEFVSPIADGWSSFYKYELMDSMVFQGNWCYKIDFKPKRSQDLAFVGTMWIADTSFALKQMDATIGKQANINYIDKVKIQQELIPVDGKTWLPSKTRVLLDIDEIGEQSPGMIAKFYTSNKNIKINEPHELKFYEDLIVVDEEAQVRDKNYWEDKRHDSLTQTEKNVFLMIDSIRNVPVIKTYVDIINVAVNGYKTVYTGLDAGPYLFTYTNNVIEGSRFRLGLRTNVDFSRKWILKGYGAYGFKDNKFKYGIGATYIFTRKPWTTLFVERKYDIQQAGIQTEFIDNALFLAFVNWGTLRKPYYNTQNTVTFQTQITKDLMQKVTLRTRKFDPLFPFYYFKDLKGDSPALDSSFNTSEIILEARFAKDELFVQNDNERISLGTKKWPVFTVRYTKGLKGILASDFNYDKLTFGLSHIVKLGFLGKMYYDINAGKVFSPVPFPLLEVHQGNQSLFFINRAYNLMNYFEFISDTYAAFKYRHYFEGLFFNRIPLVKRLKWRFLTTGNILYGGVSNKNLRLLPTNEQYNFSTFSHLIPYVELGYGVENIFKLLRVDFVHRLNYLNYPNHPKINRFGVKLSLQFAL